MKTIEIDDLTFEVLQLMVKIDEKYLGGKTTIANTVWDLVNRIIDDPLIAGGNVKITKAFQKGLRNIRYEKNGSVIYPFKDYKI
jgi:hypothetical protein